ncbi:hypothetical protein A8L34_29570 [Bacillus sp. FJAT-27264]|uniref:hypothetical protein n=1 Tax=Paenibacillus sp. (strain DSM 101736 / FJAT-27264) TaxID=1850362 RepID=UPI000807B825|nr:hypothetical protein [Bacillus sp. FJAT-27264]OBZ15166.1 hypothetical protein A8L34_29570 [Bacillus sp. FJAT-27264]
MDFSPVAPEINITHFIDVMLDSMQPILFIMAFMLALPLAYALFSRIKEILFYTGAFESSEKTKKSESPKKVSTETYFDPRANGYWVTMADGSKILVGKSDLYPDDPDIEPVSNFIQPGNYVWDSVNQKFKSR